MRAPIENPIIPLGAVAERGSVNRVNRETAMTKSKTDAKRKREKPETATKAERVKWDPSYCERVEALGSEGKSVPEIRRALGISPSAWRAWAKKHPEFAEASSKPRT